ncbi:MAG: hypothetical protein P8188_04160 [Gemmatimonadota bacterium]
MRLARWSEGPGRLHGALAFLLLLPAALAAQHVTGSGGGKTASDTLTAPAPAVDPDALTLGLDTVIAAPGENYPAGGVHRFFMGDLNRELWTLEFPVPVLDLDRVGGGLEVTELSGGKQTLGLRFKGRDSLIYQFRSIVKTPSRAIPPFQEATPVEDVLHDQMGAQFPLSAMVVAELLESAGVLVAKPRPVVMPDDPRLGEYREAFAGRMGWIEVRPNEIELSDGEEIDGFAGSDKITGTDALYEELWDDPESYVDARRLLRARLIDMLVGDWDRHSDQWRWASYADGERTRWEPIPRDRDWALSRIDGVLPSIARVYLPKYTGFEHASPNVFRFHWSAQTVDRTLLQGLDREDFRQVAAELTEALDDEALQGAVAVLPDRYLEAVGDELLASLTLRRDSLPATADRFYQLLAGWVDIRGTHEVDSATVRTTPEGVRVTLHAPEEGDFVRYDRLFLDSETREIRLYLGEDDDRVVVEGAPGIPIRIVTGPGDDRVVGGEDGAGLGIYDDEGDDDFEVGSDALVTGGGFLGQDSIRTAYFNWDTRDWGAAWVPHPEVWYDSDVGLLVGGGVARYGYGFGQVPYQSKISLAVLNGMDLAQWVVDLEWERALGPAGWRAMGEVDAWTEEPVWLFGLGNEVPAPPDPDAFRTFRSRITVAAGLRYRSSRSWVAEIGPEWIGSGEVQAGAPVLDSLAPYGVQDFDQIGLRGAFRLDTRNSRAFPTQGRQIELTGRLVPSWLDVTDTYGLVEAAWTEYLSFELPADPVLHLRVRAQNAWGRTPFFQLPYAGGHESLPGFVQRRFVGEASTTASALLRLSVLRAHLVTDVELGVQGIGSVGRVWYEAESSTRWHDGFGGGVWLRIPSLDRGVGLSAVKGDEGIRYYLDFGLLF